MKAGALEVTTGVAGEPQASSLSLSASRNPFSVETRIAYSVHEAGRAVLAIYDVAGRLVARLVDGQVAAGPNEVVWDGTGGGGARVAAGVYFVRLEAAGDAVSQKLMLIR